MLHFSHGFSKAFFFGMLVVLTVLAASTAAAYPVTIITQSDPPGITPLPTVSMDGGVTDIPPGGNASFWVNPPAGWQYTANLYNLGCNGANVADGGDARCTPRVTVTNAVLYKGNATWPAPNHFNWYQVLNPTGPITITITFKPIEYNVTLVTASDPPGLTVPNFNLDGDVTTIHAFQGRSFWVNSDATKDGLPWEAFEATTDQYNLGATGWPPNSPDYADGGDPLCTPRVTVTNAKLYKGNATWPVANHFDWYTIYDATGNVTITATYKPKNIPVSYGPHITGPTVVYHEYTGHSITVTPAVRTGYTLSGVSATDGATTDNGNGTWTLSGVTNLSGTMVTASYTANAYTVTFNAQGGTAASPATKSVTYNATYGALATTSRTGYSFEGWFTQPTGGSVVTSGSTVTTAADHTLYAQWTANNYTVTFNANGGTGAVPGSKGVTFDATYGALATTSRTGYSFEGWFTQPTGGSVVIAGTTVTTASNHTLYAQWTPNNYTVTFNANGGTAPSPGSKGVTYDAAYGPLATTSLTGYTLAGWFTAPTGGTEVTAASIVATASNHTLYAQWMLNTYTVTFDLDGKGTRTGGGDLVQTVAHGDAAVAPVVSANMGWVFDGWDVAFDTITGPLTVTAQYSVATYTVTFDLDGKGTRTGGGDLVQTVAHGDAAVAPVVSANTGWVFDGWDVAFDTITGPLTVTAQYSVATYTVTFDLDGKGTRTGGGALVQMVAHGDAAVAPTVAGNPGWVFVAWDAAFDNITGDLTVTALYDVAPEGEGEGEGEGEDEGEPEGESEGEGEGEGEPEGEPEGEGEPPVGLEVNAVGETYFIRPLEASVTLAVQVHGNLGALTYQWYKLNDDKAQTPVGPDAPSFTIDPITEADFGEYLCEVYDPVLDESASSPVFTLVYASGLPVLNLFGLALAGSLAAFVGATVLRRKR